MPPPRSRRPTRSVGKALLDRGEDAREVSGWLDAIRENGLTASFIPDDVPRGEDFVQLLEEAIGE